jgi:superfamily I DNA and/or RNA helicase
LILACAETNIAVDNLMSKLIENGLQVLRIGNPSNVKPQLREYTLEQKLKEKNESGIRTNQKKLIKEIITQVDVLCATCVTSGSELLKSMQFTHIVVDEVSQAIGKFFLTSFKIT